MKKMDKRRCLHNVQKISLLLMLMLFISNIVLVNPVIAASEDIDTDNSKPVDKWFWEGDRVVVRRVENVVCPANELVLMITNLGVTPVRGEYTIQRTYQNSFSCSVSIDAGKVGGAVGFDVTGSTTITQQITVTTPAKYVSKVYVGPIKLVVYFDVYYAYTFKPGHFYAGSGSAQKALNIHFRVEQYPIK